MQEGQLDLPTGPKTYKEVSEMGIEEREGKTDEMGASRRFTWTTKYEASFTAKRDSGPRTTVRIVKSRKLQRRKTILMPK